MNCCSNEACASRKHFSQPCRVINILTYNLSVFCCLMSWSVYLIKSCITSDHHIKFNEHLCSLVFLFRLFGFDLVNKQLDKLMHTRWNSVRKVRTIIVFNWNHFEMRLLNLRINFYLLLTFCPHLGSFFFFFHCVSAKLHLWSSSGDLPRPWIETLSLVTVSPVITFLTK